MIERTSDLPTDSFPSSERPGGNLNQGGPPLPAPKGAVLRGRGGSGNDRSSARAPGRPARIRPRPTLAQVRGPGGRRSRGGRGSGVLLPGHPHLRGGGQGPGPAGPEPDQHLGVAPPGAQPRHRTGAHPVRARGRRGPPVAPRGDAGGHAPGTRRGRRRLRHRDPGDRLPRPGSGRRGPPGQRLRRRVRGVPDLSGPRPVPGRGRRRAGAHQLDPRRPHLAGKEDRVPARSGAAGLARLAARHVDRPAGRAGTAAGRSPGGRDHPAVGGRGHPAGRNVSGSGQSQEGPGQRPGTLRGHRPRPRVRLPPGAARRSGEDPCRVGALDGGTGYRGRPAHIGMAQVGGGPAHRPGRPPQPGERGLPDARDERAVHGFTPAARARAPPRRTSPSCWPNPDGG